jgi:hypothetical protein
MGVAANILAIRYSQEQLEAELDLILAEALGGKTLTSWSVGDSSAEKTAWLTQTPEARLKLVSEALSIIDPTTYPPDSVIPITQTRVSFHVESSSSDSDS